MQKIYGPQNTRSFGVYGLVIIILFFSFYGIISACRGSDGINSALDAAILDSK
jgi:hypothetical protein